MRILFSRFARHVSACLRLRRGGLPIIRALVGVSAFCACAQGAEPTVPGGQLRAVRAQAAPYYDWSGLYVGGHVGYGRGNAQVTLADQPPDPGSINSTSSLGSLIGGVQLGYNYVLPSRILLSPRTTLRGRG